MLDSLREGFSTANSLGRHESCLLSLVKVHLQDREQRNGHERGDDRKCAESPSPATNIQLKSLSSSRSCKSSDHIRGGGESKSQSTILQARRVHCNNHVCVDSASGSDSRAKLTLIAPAAAGGGWDLVARESQQALRSDGIVNNAQVVNVPGAGGTIGLSQLENLSGQPTTVMITGTGTPFSSDGV